MGILNVLGGIAKSPKKLKDKKRRKTKKQRTRVRGGRRRR